MIVATVFSSWQLIFNIKNIPGVSILTLVSSVLVCEATRQLLLQAPEGESGVRVAAFIRAARGTVGKLHTSRRSDQTTVHTQSGYAASCQTLTETEASSASSSLKHVSDRLQEQSFYGCCNRRKIAELKFSSCQVDNRHNSIRQSMHVNGTSDNNRLRLLPQIARSLSKSSCKLTAGSAHPNAYDVLQLYYAGTHWRKTLLSRKIRISTTAISGSQIFAPFLGPLTQSNPVTYITTVASSFASNLISHTS